jgi:hypothetical protein
MEAKSLTGRSALPRTAEKVRLDSHLLFCRDDDEGEPDPLQDLLLAVIELGKEIYVPCRCGRGALPDLARGATLQRMWSRGLPNSSMSATHFSVNGF